MGVMDDCGEELGDLGLLLSEKPRWREMPGNEVMDYFLEQSDFHAHAIAERLCHDRPTDRADHFLSTTSGRAFRAKVRDEVGGLFAEVTDVMGGKVRATQLLARRHYVGGRNFDAVMGADLLQHDEEDELYRYLREGCPFVVVMAPQCTAAA
eukprot:9480326-Pyramimonas_sp.AAC.1